MACRFHKAFNQPVKAFLHVIFRELTIFVKGFAREVYGDHFRQDEAPKRNFHDSPQVHQTTQRPVSTGRGPSDGVHRRVEQLEWLFLWQLDAADPIQSVFEQRRDGGVVLRARDEDAVVRLE